MTKKAWTFVSSHGMTLCYLAANPDSTLRQVSDALGITERQVSRIVRDLDIAGILRIKRQRGRRHSYSIDLDTNFRYPAISSLTLRRLVDALSPALAEERPTP